VIGAKIDVRVGWGADFAKVVNERVRYAVAEASAHGAQVASDAARPRSRTGRMASIHAVEVKGTPTGWQGGFRSEAFYSGFQSRGTAHGIQPLRHEEAGLKTAKKRLVELIDSM
jgi:hypothetical protein